MDASPTGSHIVDKGFQFIGIFHRDRHRLGLAAERLDLGDGFVCSDLVAAIGQDNIRAVAGEGFTDGLTDAATAADDKCGARPVTGIGP